METVFNGYNCSVFAYGTTGARKNLHDAGWEGENSNVVPTLLGANVESSGLSRYHLPHYGGNLQENIHAGRQNLRGWNLLPRGLQRDCTGSPQSCRSVLVETRNALNYCSVGVLEIRETGNSTAIPGLTMHKPTGPEGILSLLTFGKFAQS